MHVGVPKEIKADERRVALIPSVVSALTSRGHLVRVEYGAGVGSGFADDEFKCAGALMCDADDVWNASELIVKVKEPLAAEVHYFRKGLALFTFLHLAAVPELAKALCDSGVTGIAYETVQMNDGRLPLLAPMSEVAGRMSIQIAAHLLESPNGGRGQLMGGVPGVPAANVVIVGAGVVGTQAMQIALGMGANVTIFDRNVDRLRSIDVMERGRVQTRYPHPADVMEVTSHADVLIGAVLIPGAKAPKVITIQMVEKMKPGSVIVDVAIDQGGSVETMDRVTSHRYPTFEKFGVLHYAVPNIPGAVPRTATMALVNATFPFLERMVGMGVVEALRTDSALRLGLNTYDGAIAHAAVAEALGMPYVAFH